MSSSTCLSYKKHLNKGNVTEDYVIVEPSIISQDGCIEPSFNFNESINDYGEIKSSELTAYHYLNKPLSELPSVQEENQRSITSEIESLLKEQQEIYEIHKGINFTSLLDDSNFIDSEVLETSSLISKS